MKIFLFLILLVYPLALSAQIRDDIRRLQQESLKELHRIEFEGNVTFSDNELRNVVSSQATKLSIPHRIIKYFHDNLEENPATPDFILKGFRDNLETMSYEKRYFNRETAEADVISLWHYYNQHGFHQPKVNYAFVVDTANENNTLYFYIEAGPRYKIDTVHYVGLDSLPLDLVNKVRERIEDRRGDFFYEGDIKKEAQGIRTFLLNNGYFFADYATPVVIKDTVNILDSVMVFFSIGKRMVIGEISYVDDKRDQPTVSIKKKRQQVTFKKGEYYDRRKVIQTIDNLLALGTFSMVAIDTFNVASAPNDTTLPFRIFTIYNEQQDIGAGLFVNQTEIDKLWNAGIEATYLHRNIFGGAQTFELRGSISTKSPWDRVSQYLSERGTIGDFFKETEWSIGSTFSEPTLFSIDGTPFSLTFSPIFAQRNLHGFFKLQALNLPFRFTAKLPNWTFINRVTFDVILERQDPLNFDKSDLVKKTQDTNYLISIRAQEAISLYENLHNYLNDTSNKHLLTANLLGATLLSEHRNNLFSPTRGFSSNFSIDGINPIFYNGLYSSTSQLAGIARFVRVQAAHYHFFELQPNLVLATKARFGTIGQFDDSISYVPVERQFFAGGANSNRGWYARTLRYTDQNLEGTPEELSRFIKDFIGSRDLIETSVELRYRFTREGMVEGIYVRSLSPWGLTAFMDIGNAYRWFYNPEDTSTTVTASVNLGEYLENLAVSIGGGIRYETPVGPIRFDIGIPIYGQFSNFKHELVFKEGLKLSYLKFHLGLGHAF